MATKTAAYMKKYMRKYRKKKRATDPDWVARQRYKIAMHTRKLNGLNVGTILRKKPKRCECCKEIPTGTGVTGLHADHDHKTGKFRGWLCSRCNHLLGQLESVYDPKKLVRKLLKFVTVESANNVGVVLDKEQLKQLHLKSYQDEIRNQRAAVLVIDTAASDTTRHFYDNSISDLVTH